MVPLLFPESAMRRALIAVLFVPAFAGMGCVSNEHFVQAEGGPVAECSDRLNLEVIPLDIWAQGLPEAEVSVNGDRASSALISDKGSILIPLSSSMSVMDVSISAGDHEATQLEIAHDGGEGVFSITHSTPSGGARAARATRSTVQSTLGERCPIVTVFVGLEHNWFASSASAPSQNLVDLGMNGDEYWGDVYDELTVAETRITWATWIWESDFELSRPQDHLYSTEEERLARTSLGILESKQSLDRRVLVNNFAEGIAGGEYISIDEALIEKAETPDDDFEVMLQGNPILIDEEGIYDGEPSDFDFASRVQANPHHSAWDILIQEPVALFDVTISAGSYHQKAVVVDGKVAFVSGMNTKGTDWDESSHRVFDHRRMDIDASGLDRAQVRNKETLPDFGPRKDYGVRIEGPAAHDVEAILHSRWELGLDAGDLYSENATGWSLDAAQDVQGDTVLAQVVATLPPPFDEMSILEAHEKAVRNAQEYIYIEDQYFRAPLLLEAIIEQMYAQPDLVLIVVTKPVEDWDPGAMHTYWSDATLRDLFPDRYLALQLKSFDAVFDQGLLWDEVITWFEPIDTHSKLRMVDDRYLSVGSCNFNNRGYLYEGEMNVEVLDDDFVHDARVDIFSNLLGDQWAERLTDDPRANLKLLATLAAENQAKQAWWEENAGDLDALELDLALSTHAPSGIVYPLEFSEDYWWEVGPDLF